MCLKSPNFLIPLTFLFWSILELSSSCRRSRPAALVNASCSFPGAPSVVVRWVCKAHGPPLGSSGSCPGPASSWTCVGTNRSAPVPAACAPP